MASSHKFKLFLLLPPRHHNWRWRHYVDCFLSRLAWLYEAPETYLVLPCHFFHNSRRYRAAVAKMQYSDARPIWFWLKEMVVLHFLWIGKRKYVYDFAPSPCLCDFLFPLYLLERMMVNDQNVVREIQCMFFPLFSFWSPFKKIFKCFIITFIQGMRKDWDLLSSSRLLAQFFVLM